MGSCTRFRSPGPGHLNRREARRLAEEQAAYLWREQYGRRY
jgi:hypothetical protein